MGTQAPFSDTLTQVHYSPRVCLTELIAFKSPASSFVHVHDLSKQPSHSAAVAQVYIMSHDCILLLFYCFFSLILITENEILYFVIIIFSCFSFFKQK